MKISTFLLFAGVMAVGLLLSAGHASAWPDSTMPHYAKGEVDCSQDHMVNPTGVGADNSYTFVMCKANSSANKMAASIKRVGGPVICSTSLTDVPASGYIQVPCNSFSAGYYYTATIWYTVPNDQTQYSQTDQYYHAP